MEVPSSQVRAGSIWWPRNKSIPERVRFGNSLPQESAMTAPTVTTLPLTAGHWTVDHNHSGVLFTVRHLGLSNVRGRFGQFEATLDVGDTLDEVSVSATVDLSSVDTNNADRDAHLRSTDFFDTEQHPVMTFHSTSIAGAGEDYELRGDLTIAGTTKEVVLDVAFLGTEICPIDQSTQPRF